MPADLLGGHEAPKPKRTRVARPQPEETPGARLAGGEAEASVSPPQNMLAAAQPRSVTAQMLAQLVETAARPEFDVEKTRALYEMFKNVRAEEAKREYAAAMNLAQAEIEPVVRATENTATRSFYATLEAVDAAIRPIYTRHGFSLSDDTVAPIVAGNIRIETQCSHIGGHSERVGREAPADTMGPKGSPTKTPLQGGGSTDTFLKRYNRTALFNVVFKNRTMPDDDGNGGPCSEEQIAQIRSKLDQLAKLDPDHDQEARLCAFLGVDTLDGLPGRQYGLAIGGLNGEIKKLTKAKA